MSEAASLPGKLIQRTFKAASYLFGAGSTAALAFAAVFPATAQAQVPQVSYSNPPNPFSLVSACPAPILGPRQRNGALIYLHGRDITTEDWGSPTPPFVCGVSQMSNLDAFRFNRLNRWDDLSGSSNALNDIVKKLKSRGYRQVVVVGHSYGSFVGLTAAEDRKSKIGAIIATVPAAFGDPLKKIGDPERETGLAKNRTRLDEILQDIHVKVALVFMKGDIFDPGGRGVASGNTFSQRCNGGRGPAFACNSRVIDQPRDFPTFDGKELIGHWVPLSRDFADRCDGYFSRFITGGPNSDALCQNDTPATPQFPVRTATAPMAVPR